MKTLEYGAYLVREIVIKYIKEKGYPPTQQEIANAMSYSVSQVNKMIEIANEKGLLVTGRGSRTIKVPGYEFVEVGRNET